jgi:hypothetical protein
VLLTRKILPTPMMKISKTDSPKVTNTVVKLLMLDSQSFIPLNPIKPKKKEMMVRVKIMFRGWTSNEFSTELKILVKLVKKNNPKQTNDAMNK